MPEYLTPGVYFETRDLAPPIIRGVRTDIAGFVGIAPRGPLHTPVRVESWRQYQAIFGSFISYGYLAYAVKGFFENSGDTCFVVRVSGPAATRASLLLKNSAGDDVIRIAALNEGVWGNLLFVRVYSVQAGARRFSLLVNNGRNEIENFRDLSLDPVNERYYARVLCEGDGRIPPSRWIEAIDLAADFPGRDPLPDLPQSGVDVLGVFLGGGREGVSSLTRDDFLGTADSAEDGKRGLGALEAVNQVAIICIPDMHIRPGPQPPVAPPKPEPPHDPCLPRVPAPPPVTFRKEEPVELPPKLSEQDISAIERAMIEHCELLKDRVAILEVPLRPSGATRTVSEAQEWRSDFDSDHGYAAFYYPWVKVVDPLRLGGSPVREIPPSGHIAGLYARTDLTTGVHKAPANEELFWAEDVTFEVNDELQGELNPEGVNCLRAFPARGIRLYGARTISTDPSWRYVNVRRLMLMIEEAVDESTQWAVFEPHNFQLRQALVQSVSAFLETQWRRGALAGETAEQAYYVKCDDTINPPDLVAQGRITVEVGVAPSYPAEFIVFRIGRTAQELEVVER